MRPVTQNAKAELSAPPLEMSKQISSHFDKVAWTATLGSQTYDANSGHIKSRAEGTLTHVAYQNSEYPISATNQGNYVKVIEFADGKQFCIAQLFEPIREQPVNFPTLTQKEAVAKVRKRLQAKGRRCFGRSCSIQGASLQYEDRGRRTEDNHVLLDPVWSVAVKSRGDADKAGCVRLSARRHEN